MKKIRLALLIAAASSVAFGSSTAYVTFTDLNSDVQGSGTNPGQTSIYTYNGETDALIAGFFTGYLICDDFNQATSVPSGPIDFSTNTISTITSSNVHFTQGTLPGAPPVVVSQIVAYDTLAVLASELEGLTPNATNTQAITDYQYAMWYLMEPNGVDGNNAAIADSPLDANATNDLKTAYNDATNTGLTNMTQAMVTADENALVIYTPTTSFSSNQEFVGLNTPRVAPEPSTWFLMAVFGLLLCIPQVRSRLSGAVSRA